MTRIARWLQTLARSLLRERAANVTFTFALAVIPIVGVVGTAVDYSRANASRTALQNALDAAALTLGKEAPSLNTNNLNKKANAYVTALFKQEDTKNVTVTGELRRRPRH